jgi:predicted TIM-barrel fold metal-dependent hydrolase
MADWYDADNHYYEPRDCFTRYFPTERLEEAIRVVPGDGGTEAVLVGDRPFTFLGSAFPERVVKPGALREMLRNLSARRDEDNPVVEDIQPEYIDRAARLKVMDEQGLTAALLLPTFGVCVEHFMDDNPARTYDNLRAFNTWLDDDWGFGSRGRIYAPPLMSLVDIDRAVVELEWALDRGARIVHLRPGPQGGKSPADPAYDPFWARVNEAGIAVAFHIGESGYNERFSVAWGEEANPSSHEQSAFQWTCSYGDRPIMDTVASMTFLNLFGRFPRVRIVSIENGSLWVPYLMKAMDKMKGMGRNGPWRGGYVPGKPSEILKRHLFVSPYHEENIPALVDEIGASQVLFGSDFPHPEGVASPEDFLACLRGLDAADVDAIMRDNTRALLAEPAA